jgi:hypothetical protein
MSRDQQIATIYDSEDDADRLQVSATLNSGVGITLSDIEISGNGDVTSEQTKSGFLRMVSSSMM